MPFKNYIKSLFFARNTIKTHPYTQKVLIYQIEVVWGQQEVLEKNMTYAYFKTKVQNIDGSSISAFYFVKGLALWFESV